MTRILAGRSKGRRLRTPAGPATRPTGARVRQKLFDILAPRIPGCRFLDAFAGSGGIGLEALSRGAARVVLIDNDAAAVAALRANAPIVAGSSGGEADVRRQDARVGLAALAASGARFDVVYLDPPYASPLYEEALEAIARGADPKMKKLALEYLVAAYGPDKMNDPEKAEPLIQRMIEIDPTDPTNYFALAKMYEDSGRYDEAEQILIKARDSKPNDSAVWMQLAGFYNRQGDFPKTIDALTQRANREPTNPEAFYTIATFYWDKAYRDFRIKDAEKVEYAAAGLKAVDQAIKLNPEYIDAIVYRGLLLRVHGTTFWEGVLRASEDALRNAENRRKQ